jgi:hypothetical protein
MSHSGDNDDRPLEPAYNNRPEPSDKRQVIALEPRVQAFVPAKRTNKSTIAEDEQESAKASVEAQSAWKEAPSLNKRPIGSTW